MINTQVVYEDGIIINADCREVVSQLPDQSIDLIATDPPYLINYKTNRRKKKHEFDEPIVGDNDKQLIADVLPMLAPKLTLTGAMYVCVSAQTQDYFVQQALSSGLLVLKNRIIWYKNSHTAGDLYGQYAPRYEVILFFAHKKGRHLLRGKRLPDVWPFDRVVGKEQLHQNQKPLLLMERIIRKSSTPGQTVLDPFMGSGTTIVAAARLARRFIGVEYDPHEFDKAKARISNMPNTPVSDFSDPDPLGE